MIRSRTGILIGVVALAGLIAGGFAWYSAGKEATDDAQIDAHVTPVAARVGGTVLKTHVVENQPVAAGALLVEIDPRDYAVAVERARAELADAEAALAMARANLPITQATASGGAASAREAVTRAQAGVDEARKGVEAATARANAARARVTESDVVARRAARDVERLRGLLAKDEIAQQQFDAAVAASDATKASREALQAQVLEAEAGVRSAESRLTQAQAAEQQARAGVTSADTVPQQIAAAQARTLSADARVQQARAALQQAELNLQYTRITAPAQGIVSRKAVEPGQVVPMGQPLMAIVALDAVWVTANFKETQVESMRPGQRVDLDVDAYRGHPFTGHVDSVSPATGARFSLLPANNATGNFVKVVQRVPVKILVDSGQDETHVLRPGMSVVPTVHVN